MRSNTTAVFVAGAAHSGSTLLGLALGAHPGIFYAGEAQKSVFFGDETKPLRKRACKVCGLECAVWGGLATDDTVDLYEALSRRTGRPVIVDSTKSLAWLREKVPLVHARGARTVLLFLGRDARAVVGSARRKYPERSVAEHTARWVAQMEGTAALALQLPAIVERVRYEALVTHPEPTLRRIAEVIGVPFDRAMLDPFSSEQHPLGGNAGTQSLLTAAPRKREDGAAPVAGAKRGYYEAHPRAFVLDERWRAELSAEAQTEIESVAGALHGEHAWPRGGAELGPAARPKVFGLGLSRTGTRSLSAALEVLGWQTVHYPVDREALATLVRGDVRFPHLEHADGITDITVSPYFEDLDRAYPGSKFVLTVRDEESWLRSCESHWASRPAFQAAPAPGKGTSAEEHETHMEVRRFLRAAVYASYEFHRERFVRAYRRHVEDVQRYFAGRPGDLLVLGITSGEGFEKLAPFLGVPVPSAPFPHKGKRLSERMAAEARARNEAAGHPTKRLDEGE